MLCEFKQWLLRLNIIFFPSSQLRRRYNEHNITFSIITCCHRVCNLRRCAHIKYCTIHSFGIPHISAKIVSFFLFLFFTLTIYIINNIYYTVCIRKIRQLYTVIAAFIKCLVNRHTLQALLLYYYYMYNDSVKRRNDCVLLQYTDHVCDTIQYNIVIGIYL